MSVRVFGLKNCDTCRKARKWLDKNGIEHEFVDLRDLTPTIPTLKKWHAALGDTLLNRRGTTWRELSDKKKARAEKNLPALFHEHPALMKRPIVIAGTKVHAGFDEKLWKKII